MSGVIVTIFSGTKFYRKPKKSFDLVFMIYDTQNTFQQIFTHSKMMMYFCVGYYRSHLVNLGEAKLEYS